MYSYLFCCFQKNTTPSWIHSVIRENFPFPFKFIIKRTAGLTWTHMCWFVQLFSHAFSCCWSIWCCAVSCLGQASLMFEINCCQHSRNVFILITYLSLFPYLKHIHTYACVYMYICTYDYAYIVFVGNSNRIATITTTCAQLNT